MKRRHEYDQHFIRSPRIVAELIGHSTIRKNDLVYDFGAGSGVISSVLSRRARQVVAIESEPKALEALRQNLGSRDNVQIVSVDARTVQLPTVAYKVFSNPPFSLSSELLKRLTESDNPPKAIYVISQKQFAQKVLQSDRHFTSSLGSELAPRYTARIRKPLRKTDFTPPPAVDTVLLELKLRERPLLERGELAGYRGFVRACYASSRVYRSIDRQLIGVPAERKPSELSVEQWILLFRNTRT